jgi:DNA polymerase III subunit epsilon
MANFVAIDFETADYGRDSACAVGLVRVENDRIVEEASCLIRPPREQFVFTHIHRITWEDVRDQPTFAEIWPAFSPLLQGTDFLVAHNAPFDRGVLNACCAAAQIAQSRHRFICTVRLARAAWGIRPTTLPNVCRHLGIGLRHHDAASDARASAEIALAAIRMGHGLS